MAAKRATATISANTCAGFAPQYRSALTISFNGSGQFLINSPGNPVVTGTTISTTWANDLTADLATGLSTCITKDGQTTPTADIPLGGNKITGLANGIDATDAAAFGQLSTFGVPGYTTTVTAAGSTTLTVASTQQQFFTGSTTQTVVLPVASTLVVGFFFKIVNNSTGVVTVQSSGGNTVLAMLGASEAFITCILASGTDTTSWDAKYLGNIYGPSSATDGDIALFNGTTGKIIKDSGTSLSSITSYISNATGSMTFWPLAAATIPSGYLAADGSAVSRTTYAALFALYSTTFGSGDGTTTFNLPNMQDRFPIGASGTKTASTTGGAATKTIAQANLPNVNFTVTDPGHTHTQRGSGNGASSGLVAGDGNSTSNLNATASATTGISVASGGSGTALDVMNPWLAGTWIIKT